MTDVQTLAEQTSDFSSQPLSLAKAFVRRIVEFDWVKCVIFTSGPVSQAHVYIDAPPLDTAYRFPIYRAEMEILGICPETVALDFRLSNIREYGGQTIPAPVQGDVVLLDR